MPKPKNSKSINERLNSDSLDKLSSQLWNERNLEHLKAMEKIGMKIPVLTKVEVQNKPIKFERDFMNKTINWLIDILLLFIRIIVVLFAIYFFFRLAHEFRLLR